MLRANYYAFFAGVCIASVAIGVALGFFVFGPLGVNAGIIGNDDEEYAPEPYFSEEAEPPYVPQAQEEPDRGYILTARDGYIVVLCGDGYELKEVTPTPINALPIEEQARLERGIHLHTEEALIRILEDYGS